MSLSRDPHVAAVVPRPATLRARVVVVVVVGVAVGCLTSFGQTYLGAGALDAFVNSASAWLVAPFAVGACMTSVRGAALAGVVVCALQLGGYELTSELRGFSTSGSLAIFWGACALIGGPLFGVGGWLWAGERSGIRGLGASLLAGVFLAEGLWLYVHELHYYARAALWIGIGGLVALTLLRGVREYRWLALTLPLGVLGEIALTRIYS
jgi:hypothetical protein